MIVRTESRCRIGITWFDSEQEADEKAAALLRFYSTGDRKQTLADANIGIAQCGRAPAHDRPGEFAVITP